MTYRSEAEPDRPREPDDLFGPDETHDPDRTGSLAHGGNDARWP